MTMEIDKAGKVFDAANTLVTEYEREGRGDLAARVTSAFAGLPVESAERLYDIMQEAR